MKRALFACVVLVVGCHKSAPTAGKADPQFDAKWQQATSSAEPAYIETERGGGLLGEVRRAVDPPKGEANADVVKGPLPDAEVASVIKRNLPGVKGCYEVEERAGTVGSGKAIVSLEIDPAGTVQNVSVDAPAFKESKLPACIQARAKGWTFPQVHRGSEEVQLPVRLRRRLSELTITVGREIAIAREVARAGVVEAPEARDAARARQMIRRRDHQHRIARSSAATARSARSARS